MQSIKKWGSNTQFKIRGIDILFLQMGFLYTLSRDETFIPSIKR